MSSTKFAVNSRCVYSAVPESDSEVPTLENFEFSDSDNDEDACIKSPRNVGENGFDKFVLVDDEVNDEVSDEESVSPATPLPGSPKFSSPRRVLFADESDESGSEPDGSGCSDADKDDDGNHNGFSTQDDYQLPHIFPQTSGHGKTVHTLTSLPTMSPMKLVVPAGFPKSSPASSSVPCDVLGVFPGAFPSGGFGMSGMTGRTTKQILEDAELEEAKLKTDKNASKHNPADAMRRGLLPTPVFVGFPPTLMKSPPSGRKATPKAPVAERAPMKNVPALTPLKAPVKTPAKAPVPAPVKTPAKAPAKQPTKPVKVTAKQPTKPVKVPATKVPVSKAPAAKVPKKETKSKVQTFHNIWTHDRWTVSMTLDGDEQKGEKQKDEVQKILVSNVLPSRVNRYYQLFGNPELHGTKMGNKTWEYPKSKLVAILNIMEDIANDRVEFPCALDKLQHDRVVDGVLYYDIGEFIITKDEDGFHLMGPTTYDYRINIRRCGAKWNADNKSWDFTSERADKICMLIDSINAGETEPIVLKKDKKDKDSVQKEVGKSTVQAPHQPLAPTPEVMPAGLKTDPNPEDCKKYIGFTAEYPREGATHIAVQCKELALDREIYSIVHTSVHGCISDYFIVESDKLGIEDRVMLIGGKWKMCSISQSHTVTFVYPVDL